MATQNIQQGWSQMTAASRTTIQNALGATNGTRRTARRKRRASKRSTVKRTAKRAASGKRSSVASKFRKGSAAAKKHMAKLRKMVKR